MNYTLIVKVHSQKVQRVESGSIRVFLTHVRSINWGNNPSVYCRVYYGKFFDVYGKKQQFYNDGFYFNKHDLFQAIKAFTEP